MSTRTALAGAILLWPALLLEAERPAASPGEFRDEFRTLDYVETSAGIALARVHPEVPTTPQIRLSPTDLNYGLPEAVARAHRDKMAQVRGEIVGRIQVGDNITPQDLITSWTARAPYLRKPYFPGLLRLQNGDLLAFYSEGMGHGNFTQGRGVMVRSHDGGLHWSPPVAVPDEQDGVRLGFGNSQFQTRDGTVWVTASRRGDNFLLRSTDNGNTWRMAPLTSERIRHLDPAGELSNGDFLWLGSVYLPVQASDAYKDGKASFAATAVLRRAAGDNPDAWDWDVGIHREFPTGFFDEASIVETRTPGRLIVLLRADSHSSYLLQSESDDYGRTWSHPRPSGIWMSEDASRPHLIRMPDGTLVCAEDERALSRTGAHVSFDDGRTWADGDRLLALDSPEYLQGDFAYPKVAALDGHRVLYILYNAFNLDPGKIGLFGRILDLKDLRERYRGVSLMLRNPVRSAGTRGHWMFDEPAGDILYEENDG